jgi:hypothetical protein
VDKLITTITTTFSANKPFCRYPVSIDNANDLNNYLYIASKRKVIESTLTNVAGNLIAKGKPEQWCPKDNIICIPLHRDHLNLNQANNIVKIHLETDDTFFMRYYNNVCGLGCSEPLSSININN